MPIKIPLYGVIFSEDPLEKINEIADEMRSKGSEFVNLLIEHIDDELENPKQRISMIHDFLNPDEAKLREFLCEVKNELKND